MPGNHSVQARIVNKETDDATCVNGRLLTRLVKEDTAPLRQSSFQTHTT